VKTGKRDKAPAASSIMIKLRNITFGYNRSQPILNRLNFQLSPNEKVGLVGPNGSGKTTLFHLIVGLLRPVEGEVEIFGKLRCYERDFWEVRRRIGLLFQDPDDQLFCPTVAEDVAFGPLNLGKTREEAKEIVRNTLEMLGLQEFEDRVTHHLSGGEKRLVSLAAVLAMSPEVLLLDEPTNGLHEETVERIAAILKNHIPSYIVISHDRQFLAQTTQRIYAMSDGNILPI
jgi:cobalt/nickel transport system ATP-binding protein